MNTVIILWWVWLPTQRLLSRYNYSILTDYGINIGFMLSFCKTLTDNKKYLN